MHKIKYLQLFFILLMSTTSLFSSMYENAESKGTKLWSLIPSSPSGSIENIYDKNKKSHVIQLKGDGTKSAYLLTLKQEKNPINKSILSWEMNYSEDFVIMVEVTTDQGKHSLIYTPGDENSHLQYGLGSQTTEGQWQTQQRDLEKDLNHFIPECKILNINHFVIKGSGRLDNIQLLNTPPQEHQSEQITHIAQKEAIEQKQEGMPIIYMNGKNPLVLQRGEHYTEAGVTAQDMNGLELNVNISHEIDVFSEGEYSVIYMATDKSGNSVIDRRRVIVGEVTEKEESVVSTEAIALEERQSELSEWEQKLEAREKELLEQKSSSIESVKRPPKDYPERPGL